MDPDCRLGIVCGWGDGWGFRTVAYIALLDTLFLWSCAVRPCRNDKSLQKAFENSKINFRVNGDYFEIYTIDRKKKNSADWKPIFLKGMNLGVALPGKFPSEFPQDFDLYMDWFEKIGEMNSNVIRIYTIFPPVFYEAFANYNLLYSDNPLYLLQDQIQKVKQVKQHQQLLLELPIT